MIENSSEAFLWEMLYQALFLPAGQPPYPREIILQPEISRYVAGWGREDDAGWLALANGKPVGAIWIRLMVGKEKGYGYINETTPELSLAVLPDYRGQGIGSRLLDHLLMELPARYQEVCLSVSADNPARELYLHKGFSEFEVDGSSIKMVWKRK